MAGEKPTSDNSLGNIYNNQGIITQGQNGNNTLNVGPVPRNLDSAWGAPLKAQILKDLPRDKPITVMAVLGDTEAIQLAQQIHAFLKANGYKLTEDGISQGVFSGVVKGLTVNDNGTTRTFVVGSNLP